MPTKNELQMSEAWHTLDAEVVARRLRSDGTSGLTSDEAAQRLTHFGANRLEQAPGRTPLAILLNQLKSLLVLLLVVAAGIAFATASRSRAPRSWSSSP